MGEAQQSIANLLIQVDQAGGFVGLVLGFILGMVAAWLLVFVQAARS